MIDPEILRKLGWGEELIANLQSSVIPLRETASKIPELDNPGHQEILASDCLLSDAIDDEGPAAGNACFPGKALGIRTRR
ncbi:MAG: hypothetical protein HY289_14075 [Planctomycetes bacterium]|nr:hypothetical protein [Planctomycetota bacterium]